MRTEAEMLSLIKEVALEDENIRAAYIEGSRVNPNAPKDIFQDYDIEYIVRTTRPFREDKEWIKCFGEILYMHYPEENVYYPSDVEQCYGWQIQFADGNRMDLHVCTKEKSLENLEMYRIIVDKDGIFKQMQDVSEERYWVKEPTELEFHSTCSNFWWCTNNVAKGLWREEIPYVMDVINLTLRPHLRRLLEWKIGVENNFSVNVGKSGKYLKKYLSEEMYKHYLATYVEAEIDCLWQAGFIMCELFHKVAIELKERLEFEYDMEQAEKCLEFLRCVKE